MRILIAALSQAFVGIGEIVAKLQSAGGCGDGKVARLLDGIREIEGLS